MASNDELGTLLDTLLDDLLLLSLQPGNDEDEDPAAAELIDAVHDDAIALYDDVNENEGEDEDATLDGRYQALRERADQLIVRHGPIKTDLPAAFAELSHELARWIRLCKQEIHADEIDPAREQGVEALHLAAAHLNDEVMWSGLRGRTDDLADLHDAFADVRKQGQALYP